MQRRILQNLLRTKSSPVIDIPLDHELKRQSRTVQNVPTDYFFIIKHSTRILRYQIAHSLDFDLKTFQSSRVD